MDPAAPVLLESTADRVRLLTLNRPKSRNALSAHLREQFFGAVRAAEGDGDVDVIVITGADPAFCAGLDLRELGDEIPDLSPHWPELTKPVIGAINGPAITGGLEIALYCDILVASEKAVFADTHARVGLMPGWGMSVRLPQAVGRQMARRMSLSGEFIHARQALEIGLVTEVVAHESLLETALGLGRSIAAANQRALRALVAASRQMDALTDGPSLEIEADACAQWLRSNDTSALVARNRETILNNGRGEYQSEVRSG